MENQLKEWVVLNIKKMLEAQKELDVALFQKGGLKEYPRKQIKTAYRVELGEVLQEWKSFKYWKKNKGIIDKNKLLEEVADCLHFALSLEGEIKNYNFKEVTEEEFEDYDKYDIYNIIDECFVMYRSILGDTIALGLKLGFTLDQLEEAYYKKNKINWDRIANNY